MANWKHKLDVSDVFHNDEMTLIEKRDAVVARLKVGPWVPTEDEDPSDEFILLIEELAEVEDEQSFNEVWAAVYDWADEGHRLWLNVWTTFAPPAR